MSDFPCTKCGCCCKHVDRAIANTGLYFPFKIDSSGRCEKLGEDNLCTVYDERPLLCNIKEMGEVYLGISEATPEQEKGWHNINIAACNKLMDEDNAPLNLRIPIDG